MIEITYEYDNCNILAYSTENYTRDEIGTLVVPGQDEFVDIENTTYRVETVTHTFVTVNNELNQFVTIKLTRQLALRCI